MNRNTLYFSFHIDECWSDDNTDADYLKLSFLFFRGSLGKSVHSSDASASTNGKGCNSRFRLIINIVQNLSVAPL